MAEGFTKKHEVTRLVYFEAFDHIEHAIQREKRLKKWPRAWKVSLIEKQNLDWIDLYAGCRGWRIGLWDTGSPGQAWR